MKHSYCAECDDVRIRPLLISDLEYLRIWRNDKNNSAYLRKISYISMEAQMKWYNDYLNDDNIIFFAIVDNKREVIVGSLALYNFENDHCEIGKIIIGDSSAHGKGIGYRSLLLAIVVAIKQLNIHSFNLAVHEDNIPAKKIYDKVGFKVIGKHSFEDGGSELEMIIDENHFFLMNPLTNSIRIC